MLALSSYAQTRSVSDHDLFDRGNQTRFLRTMRRRGCAPISCQTSCGPGQEQSRVAELRRVRRLRESAGAAQHEHRARHAARDSTSRVQTSPLNRPIRRSGSGGRHRSADQHAATEFFSKALDDTCIRYGSVRFSTQLNSLRSRDSRRSRASTGTRRNGRLSKGCLPWVGGRSWSRPACRGRRPSTRRRTSSRGASRVSLDAAAEILTAS